MLTQPWDICDAHIPNYDQGITVIKQEDGPIIKSIASKIHRVLVITANKCNFLCLPIVPTENRDFYLPVGNAWFANPFKIHHVTHNQFHGFRKNLPAPDQEIVREHMQGLYALLVKDWCQQAHWAELPLAVFVQERFMIKRRPVVTIGYDLHLPFSTNGGRYIQSGPVIPFWNKPWQVDHIPVFSPKNFVKTRSGMLLSSRQKKEVQDHALQNLPNLFWSSG